MRKTGVFALAALSASSVFSATYYWNRQDTDWHDWSDAENWLVDDGGSKVAATQAPGAGDVIKRRDTQKPEKMYVDLGAGKVELGGIFFAEGSWGGDDIQLKNGTLKLTDTSITTSWYTPTKITLDHASLLLNSPVKFGHGNYGDNSRMTVTIGEGSLLEFSDMYWWARVEFHVNDGGTMRVLGAANPQNANASAEVPILVEKGGVLDFEKGYNNFKSGPWSYHPHVTLNGEWLLGGKVSYSNNIKFRAELVSGTLKATDDASFKFHESGWGRFDDDADVTLEAVEGKTLDLSNFTYEGSATVTLQGAGTIKLPAEGAPTGVVLKDAQKYAVTATGAELQTVGVKSADAAFTVGAANLTIAQLDLTAGKLVIEEPGLAVGSATMGAEGIVSVVGLSVGDTVVTSEDAPFLAAVQAQLTAAGVNSTIDGTALKLAASEVKFDSKTVTNINDPTGWSNGAVPEVGMSAQVLGEGVNIVVSGSDSAIPVFSSLTIGAGATLTLDAEDAVVPCPLTLQAGAKLIVARTATLTGLSADLGEDGEMNVLTVPAGATLKVPGNTRFTNLSLDLKGSIVATSDGKLVFGYAKNGETAKFAMTATGATITALNAAGNENGSRIEFVCPASGGAVEVVDEIILTETTFTYNSLDGFAFGLNNPADKAFTVKATKTDLNIGAETVVAGAANLVLEGSRLLRKRHVAGDSDESKYNIVVQNKGRITVGKDASIYAGITRVNGDTTNGAIRLQPDEAGFVGLEFVDGGTAHWYKANGYDKGAISFGDSTFEMTRSQWWSWNNRSHIFNAMTAIELQEGKTLTFKGVMETLLSANDDTYGAFIFESPFTGKGDIYLTGERTDKTLQPTIVRNDNSCTGTLSVDPTAKVKVHFANGANWSGTVALNDRIDFQPEDNDHKAESGNPAEVTFGAVKLIGDYALRLWGGEDGFKNDKINITGAGWSAEGTSRLIFAMQGGYEPKQGDTWLIGTAPEAATLPIVSEKWAFTTEPVEGKEGFVNVYLTPAAVEFDFVSNASGSTDLTDPTAWSSGSVPTGKEVTILGESVVAEINADQGLPSFASIAVKGGATLRINADLSETKLPPMEIDAASRLEIVDGAVAKLPEMLTTNAKVVDETVSVSKILVAKEAKLVVPAGTVFKNVDLEVYGTIKSAGAGTLAFGTASAGETAYFALKAEGATFDLPGQDNGGITSIKWLSPSEGGCVKALGDIVLKDCLFPLSGWADYHTQKFCVNNPTDEAIVFIWDNTILQASFATTIAGAAQMTFKNGAYLTRATPFAGHGGDVTVADAAVVTFDGENSGMSFNTQTIQSLMLNTSVGAREAIVLKDGAYINVRRVFAYNGAGLAVQGTGAKLMVDKPTNQQYALYSGAKVTVDKGATVQLLATNYGGVGDNVDRDVVFLGQFSGAGDVEIANLTDKKFNVLLMNGSDAFTGSIKVVPPAEETEANATTMTFAANDRMGLDWTGATLVLDNHVKMAEDGVTLTFGEINVAEDYALRFDENAPAGMLDMINATGKGFSGEGKLIIAVSDTFNPGRTVYSLGTMAKGAALPKLKGNYWKVVTETDAEGVITYGLKRNLGFCINFR